MARNIKGNHDGVGGRNDSYTIAGRGVIKRKELVTEVENGKHSNFSVYENKSEKFVRSNPDSTENNNVNK